MSKIRNFEEANTALLQYVPPFRKERRYTLERMNALMQFLGNPQEKLKVVHVAGTSGKTSTSYYIAAMLHEAGFNVGLTVSPHIDQVNERVQINGTPLPEHEFCAELEAFLELIKQFDDKPTYFEVLIAFVYWQFAKQEVDYAVIEVGLGGLLDGTNVAKRADKVCVITDIGLDHVPILGRTIEEIAAQKAGIIHPHNEVFSYQQDESIMEVFRDVAQQNQATLHEILPASSHKAPTTLPLFQRRNWYLAAQVVSFILDREGKPGLTSEQLQRSSHIVVPARMEIRSLGDKTLIIDGSHNEQKLGALLKSIKQRFPGQPMALLVSFGHNKSASLQASLKLLTESNHIFVTTFSIGQDEIRRPINPKKIADTLIKLGYHEVSVDTDPAMAFRELLKRPEHLLVITGSFYLLNHIRPLVNNEQL